MAEKDKGKGDQPVLGHIKQLVDEEHKLYSQGKLHDEDRSRLERIQVELDQCSGSLASTSRPAGVRTRSKRGAGTLIASRRAL